MKIGDTPPPFAANAFTRVSMFLVNARCAPLVFEVDVPAALTPFKIPGGRNSDNSRATAKRSAIEFQGRRFRHHRLHD